MAAEVLATKRSAYWDNIKGLLIFLVVFAHFLYDFQGDSIVGCIVLAIYTFHMPAFIFVTGYFSKSDHSRSPAAIAKLGAAYFVFNGVFIIRSLVLGSPVMFLSPYYSMWYLLAVIVWRLTVPYLCKRPRVLVIASLIAVLVGFAPDVSNVFAMQRIVAFYPFFLAGYLFTPEHLTAIKSFAKKKRWAIIPCGSLLLADLIFVLYKTFRFTANNLMMCAYSTVADVMCRIAVLAIAGLAILLLLCAAPSRNIPFMTKIGRNSLPIYLLHRYFTLVFTRIYPKYFGGYMRAGYIIPIAFALTILFLWALSSRCVSDPLNRLLDCGADIVLRPSGYSACSKWRYVYLLIAIVIAVGPAVRPFLT